jgi:hypothetical protein
LKEIQSYDKDTVKEEVFLEIFEYLNKDELEPDKLLRVNKSLANLIKWVRSIISYHILVHPYKVRNTTTIEEESDIY